MKDIIRELYYLVDDWADQHNSESKEVKDLLARRQQLQEKIILRLGNDGQELMEALSNLNLDLKDLHDEALFRAAMRLGTQIAQPDGVHSTSR